MPTDQPNTAAGEAGAQFPLLSRAETIVRLAHWANEMQKSAPPKTGFLHLQDAIYYMANPPPPPANIGADSPMVRASLAIEGRAAQMHMLHAQVQGIMPIRWDNMRESVKDVWRQRVALLATPGDGGSDG